MPLTTQSFTKQADQLNAIDGILVRQAEITVTEFDDLDIPATATIKGIVVTWTGAYSTEEALTGQAMVVNNGTDTADNGPYSVPSTTPSIYPDITSVDFGTQTELWGLSWTPTTAAAISVIMTAPLGTLYHDAFKVTIYYELKGPAGIVKLKSGIVKLTEGKVVFN